MHKKTSVLSVLTVCISILTLENINKMVIHGRILVNPHDFPETK